MYELHFNNDDNKFYYSGGDYDGQEYTGNDSFVSSVTDALDKLESGGDAGKLLVSLLSGDDNNNLKLIRGETGNKAGPNGDYIKYDKSSANGGLDQTGNTSRPNFIALGHEMAHILDTWLGTKDESKWFNATDINGNNQTVPNAEKIFNLLRK